MQDPARVEVTPKNKVRVIGAFPPIMSGSFRDGEKFSKDLVQGKSEINPVTAIALMPTVTSEGDAYLYLGRKELGSLAAQDLHLRLMSTPDDESPSESLADPLVVRLSRKKEGFIRLPEDWSSAVRSRDTIIRIGRVAEAYVVLDEQKFFLCSGARRKSRKKK